MIYAGIRVVIAGSFSETFKRNAINNGLLVLEAPKLVIALRAEFGTGSVLSRRTGWNVTLNLLTGALDAGTKGIFEVPKVGTAAQEIVVEGGLEAWVKNRI